MRSLKAPYAAAVTVAVISLGGVAASAEPRPETPPSIRGVVVPDGVVSSPLGWSAELAVTTPAFDRVLGVVVASCMEDEGVAYSGDPVDAGLAAGETAIELTAVEFLTRRYTPPEQRDGVFGYVFEGSTSNVSADASAPLSDEQLKALWGEDQSTDHPRWNRW